MGEGSAHSVSAGVSDPRLGPVIPYAITADRIKEQIPALAAARLAHSGSISSSPNQVVGTAPEQVPLDVDQSPEPRSSPASGLADGAKVRSTARSATGSNAVLDLPNPSSIARKRHLSLGRLVSPHPLWLVCVPGCRSGSQWAHSLRSPLSW